MPSQARAEGLGELIRIMELRAVKATADYLAEWDATDAKHRPKLKDSPMVKLVRELQTARNDRIRQDGIRRKIGAPRG